MHKKIQDLVNAQVSVNRAVFEGNRDNARPEYLQECAKAAITNLRKAIKIINRQVRKNIAKKAKDQRLPSTEEATTTAK